MVKIIDTAQVDFNAVSADENHWLYNGLDCCVTGEIFTELNNTIDDCARQTYEFSKALQGPVLEMNLRGVLVNQNKRRQVTVEMEHKRAQLGEQFNAIVRDGIGIEPVNWNSPKQLGNLLYDVMGLPVQKKRNAHGIYARTTNRDALENLSQYYIAEPVVNHLMALADLEQALGFLRTPLDSDGRLRTQFGIAGTVSGRFNSSMNDATAEGTNLQNVTESLRSIFVPDPGYKFANLDLEQGDSRNVGALCWNLLCDKDEAFAGSYLNACESGDLHTSVAKMTLPNLPWGSKPDREVAETLFYRHWDYRFMCKKLGHGSNYLGQPAHMAKQSKFPLSNVKSFQAQYFAAFPCIPAWHQSVFWNLENLGYLISLYGRRRFFFGRPKEASTKREAVAHVPQSMTADAINTGILNVWRANRVQLLLQVHDSILFQFKQEMEDEIIPWALTALRSPLVLAKDRPFCIPTEAKTGFNWGNYSDDNPDGLKKWKGHDDRQQLEKNFRLSFLSI